MKRILIVDDDAPFRERLVRALCDRGFDAIGAADGAAALAAVSDRPCDGAVVDMRMPGMSGVEVVAALNLRCPDARIIVLTGYGSIATALDAVRHGAADYLQKPADADQIAACLLGAPPVAPPPEPDTPSLDRVEWEHIQRVLTDCGGNVSRAAEALGIHRRSLQRKLSKFPPPR